jgi:hypothetical protein
VRSVPSPAPSAGAATRSASAGLIGMTDRVMRDSSVG